MVNSRLSFSFQLRGGQPAFAAGHPAVHEVRAAPSRSGHCDPGFDRFPRVLESFLHMEQREIGLPISA